MLTSKCFRLRNRSRASTIFRPHISRITLPQPDARCHLNTSGRLEIDEPLER